MFSIADSCLQDPQWNNGDEKNYRHYMRDHKQMNEQMYEQMTCWIQYTPTNFIVEDIIMMAVFRFN